MMYGAEVVDSLNCHYCFELKTQMGVLKRLERDGISNLVYNGYGWIPEPIGNNRFVVYSRSGGIFKKESYTTLYGNYKGSWEFWG